MLVYRKFFQIQAGHRASSLGGKGYLKIDEYIFNVVQLRAVVILLTSICIPLASFKERLEIGLKFF